ncbi:hypothetical protein [Leptotrichia buccalis]|jgi:hypothetical protein|uniref:Lipoprotein n=1 Tax=Leptotrichia buccalis (strain ATCC 14201 / DSM 1135 / JCM 12969 / NCTC 10249 / C-1013-b) TaxID=523794 RepID=C7ND66_LEPBD|nr:hypothetical protein [Leptotrichia buccalis]ACV39944.1 hypothetical protein Lebu_2085 [Leptotrichia buccalis C-1013-b]
MKKSKKIIGIALLLMSISYIGNAKTVNKTGKNQNVKKTDTTKRNAKELNSQEYAQVLSNFQKKAEKYLETGDKIKLVDDYINDIENAKVSEKALEDNKKADMEVFGMVEVAIFMKSMYSDGAEAKKLTDADYERIQKKFASTNKFKQLEGYVQIQPITQ